MLKLHSRIKRWGDPYGGGWLDWPAGHIDKLTIVGNVSEAYGAFKRYTGKETFDKAYPGAWQIVTAVMTMREEAGLNWFTGLRDG